MATENFIKGSEHDAEKKDKRNVKPTCGNALCTNLLGDFFQSTRHLYLIFSSLPILIGPCSSLLTALFATLLFGVCAKLSTCKDTPWRKG